ncbi:HD domain-containing phosphohydrolase [Ancylobacter sp. VNQ12]|uniref:HD domain-containing phosphohydrolase n=1 Tax=Ancylobacter sp. VNQ12 TaxID=3400920 RepID=UPI003C09475E
MARRRLDTHLALVFGVTITLALAGIIVVVNNRAAAIVEDATTALFASMAGESRSHIDKNFNTLDVLVQVFAADPQLNAPDEAARMSVLDRFRTVMDSLPFTSAIYVGYTNGDFLLLRHLTSDVARRNLQAGEDAAYLLQVVEQDGPTPQASFTFLDGALRKVGELQRPGFSFDPRQRPWFIEAMSVSEPILTRPYRFFATAESGVTIAQQLESGRGVIGIDLSLADLSSELRRMKSTPSTEIVIADQAGWVLAASNPVAALPQSFDGPPRRSSGASAAMPDIVPDMLRAVRGSGTEDHSAIVRERGQSWMMHVAPLRSGPWTFAMAVAMPHDEIIAGVRRLVATLGWISLAFILFVVVAIRLTARAVSRPLMAIAGEAEAMQAFNFRDEPGVVRSSVAEIDTLSRAIRNARLTIQRFIEIGRTLAAERDPERLMQRLLTETTNLTGAEAGLILLSEDSGKSYSAVVYRPDAVVAPDEGYDGETEMQTRAQRLDAGAGSFARRLVNALQRSSVSHVDVKPAEQDPFFAGLTAGLPLKPDELLRYSVIPLRNRGNETMGALVLINRVGEHETVSDDSLDLARALSGNAAVAIETTLLLKSRKALLDAVIRMIAQATDAKSPYTNGHCQRVPILTHALVQAACEAREGPSADFHLSPDEWEAVDVAAWLHDCGKLTTAEYVIDKATKLETIWNRIHEVRMRFELLKAKADTEYWKGVAEGGDAAGLRAARDATWRELDEEFAFVADCNLGGEFMEPAKIERLKRIAARRWTRTLDDRLGISTGESQRFGDAPAPTLPVEEPLLADKPQHIVPHFRNELDEQERKAGFAMKRPAVRLDLGELHNLSIPRGTLTEEERYEINRHVTRSILMLEALPLSGALTKVPEFAGGHHERMDGKGYPRGLTRDQMSPVARMMAIADVFEALTAGDRPYKKAKTLSEAIAIMGAMKRDNHLDPELLDLFLTCGHWRDYARRYLRPEQIDEPDIAAVLAIRPNARTAPLDMASA